MRTITLPKDWTHLIADELRGDAAHRPESERVLDALRLADESDDGESWVITISEADADWAHRWLTATPTVGKIGEPFAPPSSPPEYEPGDEPMFKPDMW